MIRRFSVTLLLALALAAQAGSMQFRGHLNTPEGGGHGLITIDSRTIEVEARKLFSKESFSVRLNDARSVRVRQGLFHTKVIVQLKDRSGDDEEGSRDQDLTVTMRTHRKHYEELKALLKSRIS